MRSVLRRLKALFYFVLKVYLVLGSAYIIYRMMSAILHVPVSYHMTPPANQKEIIIKYAHSELDPRVAMVCPEGFAISAIRYKFYIINSQPPSVQLGQGGSLAYANEDALLADYSRIELNKQSLSLMVELEKLQLTANGHDKQTQIIDDLPRDDIVYHKKNGANGVAQNGADKKNVDNIAINEVWAGAGNSLGPCPTLVYCLGHQACLFHYSNRFCQNDPLPGSRKVLDMRLCCVRNYTYDATLANYIKTEQDKPYEEHVFKDAMTSRDKIIDNLTTYTGKTTFLKYETVIEASKSKLTPPAKFTVSNREVFNITCPLPHEIHKMGYRGNCGPFKEAPQVTSDHMWSRLAREASGECRKQLLESYCAYMYNPEGLCLPPHVIDSGDWSESSSGIKWSYYTMPETGPRHDLQRYATILQDHNMPLIPARIAFLIMAHEGTDAIMQLINQIYRPHNYIVIIMDVGSSSTREQLEVLVKNTYPEYDNIRMLPQDRSFAASWGSYIIQRAQLECYEELLQMGVWDFAIYMSGRDLLLRSVDDLSYALAPYRGRSIFRVNGRVDLFTNPFAKNVWQSCNRHVFNVTQRKPLKGLEMWGTSNFHILSRDYVEFVLSPQRGLQIDMLQYFIQTSFIPDEQYMGTILFNSNFKSTAIDTLVYVMKPFKGENSDFLCRHQEETDACGMGPPELHEEDLEWLLALRHNFLMSRKYALDVDDPARSKVMEALDSNTYYTQMAKEYFPIELINRLVDKVVYAASERLGIQRSEIARWNLEALRVVPQLETNEPCCQYTPLSMEDPLRPFRIIPTLKLAFQDGREETIIANVDLKDTAHSCYPGGHIQAVFVTTRHTKKPKPPTNTQEPNKEQRGFPGTRPRHEHDDDDFILEPVIKGVPSVLHPAGGKTVWIYFLLSNKRSNACSAFEKHPAYADVEFIRFNIPKFFRPDVSPAPKDFPSKKELDKYNIPIVVTMNNEKGEEFYREIHQLEKGHLAERPPDKPERISASVFTIRIDFHELVLHEGMYTVKIKQLDNPDGFEYESRLYLADGKDKESSFTDKVMDMYHLTHVARESDIQKADQYYQITPIQDVDTYNTLIAVPLWERVSIVQRPFRQRETKLISTAVNFTEGFAKVRPSPGFLYFVSVEYAFMLATIIGFFYMFRYHFQRLWSWFIYKIRYYSKFKRCYKTRIV